MGPGAWAYLHIPASCFLLPTSSVAAEHDANERDAGAVLRALVDRLHVKQGLGEDARLGTHVGADSACAGRLPATNRTHNSMQMYSTFSVKY